MIILDGVQDDIGSMTQIQRWMGLWKRELPVPPSREDIVAAVASLVKQGLLEVYDNSADEYGLTPVDNPTINDRTIDDCLFRPTSAGTRLWEEWEAPEVEQPVRSPVAEGPPITGADEVDLGCEFWPPAQISLRGAVPEIESLATWLRSAQPGAALRCSVGTEPRREGGLILAGVEIEPWSGGVKFAHRANRFVIASDPAGLKWLDERLEGLAKQARAGKERRGRFWYLGDHAPIPQDSYELIVDALPLEGD